MLPTSAPGKLLLITACLAASLVCQTSHAFLLGGFVGCNTFGCRISMLESDVMQLKQQVARISAPNQQQFIPQQQQQQQQQQQPYLPHQQLPMPNQNSHNNQPNMVNPSSPQQNQPRTNSNPAVYSSNYLNQQQYQNQLRYQQDQDSYQQLPNYQNSQLVYQV